MQISKYRLFYSNINNRSSSKENKNIQKNTLTARQYIKKPEAKKTDTNMVNLSGFSKIGNNIMGSIQPIQNFKVKKDDINLLVRNSKHQNNKGNGLTKEGEELFNKMDLNLSINNSFEERENGGNGGNFDLSLPNPGYRNKNDKNGSNDKLDNSILLKYLLYY